MSTRPIVLDFSLSPVRDHTKIWVRLPSDIETHIAKLPATASRIEMALRFCTKIGNLEGEDDETQRQREGYMRAALAEAVSVEDTLKWERPDEPFELWWSSNPLLHVLRELRNINVHLRPSTFQSQEIAVRLAAPDSPEMPMAIYTLTDFTVERFSELRNARRYTEDQISGLVSWFNSFHVHWGIADAIHQGLCAVASEVVERYGLRG